MPDSHHASTPPAGSVCGLCGASLPAGRPDAVCSGCLLGMFDGAAEEDFPEVPGYELLGELARGGMGVVYRAHQASPDREVALKVLLPRFAEEPEMLARFEIEARAMAGLDHPGILPVYEVGAAGGSPFFSMKYVAGGSLADRLKNGPMEARAAAAMLASLAEAVHYAHQHGVLHRDLKPGNFLFDREGRAYVSDFGLAKLPLASGGGLTRTGSFFGTPHYMPPEVAGGSAAESTVAGDVYALGAVLYECLTGLPPHARHANVGSLLRAIVDEPVVPLRVKRPGVPRDLEVICQKAIEKAPGARYASAAAFADDLGCWLRGYPISARATGPIGRLWRWSRRHPVAAGLAAVLLAVTLAGTLLLATSHRDRGVALDQARRQLHRSLIEQAKSERLLGAPGHRSRALSLLRQAAALAPDPAILDEVAAGLARTDLTEIEASKESVWKPFWPDRLPDGDEVSFARASWSGHTAITLLSSGRAALWKRGAAQPVAVWEPAEGRAVVGDVLPDDSGVVLVGASGGDGVYSGTPGDRPRLVISAPAAASFVSVARTKSLAAIGGPTGMEVVEADSGRTLWRSADGPVRCRPVWSPDGGAVAVALGETRAVLLLDGGTGRRLASLPLVGWPELMAFHPSGALLAVSDSSGRLTLAEPGAGRVVTSLEARVSDLEFWPGGSMLQAGDGQGGWRNWRLETSTVFREWTPAAAGQTDGSVFHMRLSPDGSRLLTSATAGVRLWSVGGGREIGFIPAENQRIDAPTAAWWLGNYEVLIQVPGGLERIPVDTEGRPGPARRVSRPPGAAVLDVRSDGSWLVRLMDDEGGSRLEVWPDGDSSRAVPGGAAAEPSAEHEAATLDGRLRAVAGPDDRIQLQSSDARWQRQLVPPFPMGAVQIAFVSGGRRLVLVSRENRVFAWDLAVLEQELKRCGF